MGEKQLEVLHDHYKETFALIREREKQRDRLTLVLIGLFALLAVEVQYPANFRGALGKLGVGGLEVELADLPLPALLNASWVLTLVVALRYCQSFITIERQYSYLHALEDKISPELGGEDVYRREGKMYLQDYPLFLDVVWISYIVLLPLTAAGTTISLLVREWTGLDYPLLHKVFDSFVGTSVVGAFILARTFPQLAEIARSGSRAKGIARMVAIMAMAVAAIYLLGRG